MKQLVVVCRDVEVNWQQFSEPIYVGVESGVLALGKKQLPIAFACGDFDSVSTEELTAIETASKANNFPVLKVAAAKDYLDAELAIVEAINQKLVFDQIVLITEGYRWDMVLAQINLLRKYQQYQPILISSHNYFFALKVESSYTFTAEQLKYQYVSFFPLTDEEVVYNFIGCQYYPGQDITINNQDVLAVSNQFALQNGTKPTITIKKGWCLVCLAKK